MQVGTRHHNGARPCSVAAPPHSGPPSPGKGSFPSNVRGVDPAANAAARCGYGQSPGAALPQAPPPSELNLGIHPRRRYPPSSPPTSPSQAHTAPLPQSRLPYMAPDTWVRPTPPLSPPPSGGHPSLPTHRLPPPPSQPHTAPPHQRRLPYMAPDTWLGPHHMT